MAITRTPILDDDGSGESGTGLDNAWKQEFYDQIDAADAALAAAIAAVTTEVLTVSAAGTVTLTAGYRTHILNCTQTTTIAVLWSGGSPAVGDRVVVKQTGAGGVVTIAHGSPILNMATSAPTPIAQNGSAQWIYMAGAWTMIAHEQGAWITSAYAAGNFTGNGSMTWTVDAGDQTIKYRLSGRTLTVKFQLATFSIGGTPNIALQIANGAFGGFTILGAAGGAPAYTATAYLSDNATVGPGYSSANGTTFFSILKQAATNWAASTNNSYAYGSAELEVS